MTNFAKRREFPLLTSHPHFRAAPHPHIAGHFTRMTTHLSRPVHGHVHRPSSRPLGRSRHILSRQILSRSNPPSPPGSNAQDREGEASTSSAALPASRMVGLTSKTVGLLAAASVVLTCCTADKAYAQAIMTPDEKNSIEVCLTAIDNVHRY